MCVNIITNVILNLEEFKAIPFIRLQKNLSEIHTNSSELKKKTKKFEKIPFGTVKLE